MNTQNVKTAAHESTERCGRKGKKANVLFRMAVVSSQPVADSEMKAMCNYIRVSLDIEKNCTVSLFFEQAYLSR
ncbi:hypothetical protein S576_23665 [Salmonella enterica subsp. enterica serovar Give]|nr:hypothetical protein [Salmonella enterica subsp. enterica serovar Give]EED4548152.1 hypothetical protein [Salmonella enterica subsp. enterica serovar Give]